MGGVLAEKLRKAGLDVTLVTPGDVASAWTGNTLEAVHINKQLRRLGIDGRHASRRDRGCGGSCGDHLRLWRRPTQQIAAAAVVLVTSRLPNEALYLELTREAGRAAGRRHQVGHAHRRLPGAGLHRARGLSRPPLRARTRRAAGRRGAVQAPPADGDGAVGRRCWALRQLVLSGHGRGGRGASRIVQSRPAVGWPDCTRRRRIARSIARRSFQSCEVWGAEQQSKLVGIIAFRRIGSTSSTCFPTRRDTASAATCWRSPRMLFRC